MGALGTESIWWKVITDFPFSVACNYAIHRLAYVTTQCPFEPTIFTPYSSSSEAVRLPLMFIGQGPDYTPPTPIWCTLLVLWQPKQSARAPPPTLADLFPFTWLLEAADAIRDYCWGGNYGLGSIPVLGRTWVLPNEWVDVQFGVVMRPEGFSEKLNVSEKRGPDMTVLLADGSNMTLTASTSDRHDVACGGLLGLKAECSVITE